MFEKLKKEVLDANLYLPKYHLVTFTWGNVSQRDESGNYFAIKPSGVEYDTMTADDIVVLDMEGHIVSGHLKPSSDTPTHLELYKKYPSIKGICHTHSRWATIFSQMKKDIPALGTTHGDYFYGAIPVTRDMTKDEIQSEYEKETGSVIIETIEKKGYAPMSIPAILVANHGPFTWGKSGADAVFNAVVLEEVAFMAWHTILQTANGSQMSQDLLDKHYLRKHGANKYYGQ